MENHTTLGTDIGPVCSCCGGTIYSYPARRYPTDGDWWIEGADCVGCGNVTDFAYHCGLTLNVAVVRSFHCSYQANIPDGDLPSRPVRR